MKTYVISLKYPKVLLNDLQTQGFNPNLVEGVDGSKMSYQEKQRECTPFFALFGLPSAIGCALAHKKAIRQFLDSDDELVLIFEDDAVIVENFSEHVSTALQNVPQNFDILYMDCSLCYNTPYSIFFETTPTKKVNEYVIEPSMALGTHCYILSRKGAEKILSTLDKVDDHIDRYFNKKCAQGELVRYTYLPDCVYQTSIIDSKTSSMMRNNHPSIIQPVTQNIDSFLESNANIDYHLNIATYQVAGCKINLMVLVFFILGVLLSFSGLSLKFILIGFFILSLQDLMLLETYFHLLILLFGFQLQHMIK